MLRNSWTTGCLLLAVTLATATAAISVAVAQVPDSTGTKPPIAKPVLPPADPESVDYWQPMWMQRELWGPGKMSKSMQARVLRHWTFTHYGIPDAYKDATSPVTDAGEAIDKGRAIYARDCASCHGQQGLGGGAGARSLVPSPALLAFMIQRPIAVDSYLLWSIAEGGTAFGTEMPAFKSSLTRQQIWELIAYMRAGFPDRAPAPKANSK